jgi:hypothetical protein
MSRVFDSVSLKLFSAIASGSFAIELELEAKSKVPDWGIKSTLAEAGPGPMVNVLESTLEWT